MTGLQVTLAVFDADGQEVTPIKKLISKQKAIEAATRAEAEAKAEAEAQALRAKGFFRFLTNTFRRLLFLTAATLTLFYAASVLAGVPPKLTFEFGVGAVVVSWAITMLRSVLGPRPLPYYAKA